MNNIISELSKSNKFTGIIKDIENKKSPLAITGLTDVGMSHIVSGINEFSKKNILLVTYNEVQAKKIVEDLKNFIDKVYYFPKKEIVTYDYIAESKDLPYERIETLNKIVSGKNAIIVATIESLMQKLPAKEVLYKDKLDFKVGKVYDLELVKEKLVALRICKK